MIFLWFDGAAGPGVATALPLCGGFARADLEADVILAGPLGGAARTKRAAPNPRPEWRELGASSESSKSSGEQSIIQSV